MNTELEMECLYFSETVFGIHPPQAVVDLYERAHQSIFSNVHDGRHDFIRRAVERRFDVEALEMALRFRDPNNLLSKKLAVLVYVLETHPDTAVLFVNREAARFKAYARLGAELVRSACKWAKGRILLHV